jgi:tetrahydromethanopterin S-methyltransferase subunit G
MSFSWKALRKQFIVNENELGNLRKQISQLQRRLDNKESEISERFDIEIARISKGKSLTRK